MMASLNQYRECWAPVERLWSSIDTIDPTNQLKRGFILVSKSWEGSIKKKTITITITKRDSGLRLRHSVRMSLGVCPGPSPKFWRLVGCIKFWSLGAKSKLRSVAFQPCISMREVNIVKIGEKRDFVQILGLKTPISVDRNFDHLTSEGSVARNFEISSSLTPSLQNMDIDGPN